jgi:hypothetical protein
VPVPMLADMTILRMDYVSIVVEDLHALAQQLS